MLADYGPRSEGGAGAVARSRSLRNARSKLDKKRLAFVVVSDDFSLERRSCGPEQISGSFYVETSNHRSLPLNITKEFYEYCANHTIKLSPPSALVGRWTTTVGGAVDRLGGNASPPKWKQSYNIQLALNGGLGWYILLAGWLHSRRDGCRVSAVMSAPRTLDRAKTGGSCSETVRITLTQLLS